MLDVILGGRLDPPPPSLPPKPVTMVLDYFVALLYGWSVVSVINQIC